MLAERPPLTILTLLASFVVSTAAWAAPAFHADFDLDTPDQPPSTIPPGPPDGDAIRLRTQSGTGGSILVRSAVGSMTDQPVEIERFDGGSVAFHSDLDPSLTTCPGYTISYTAMSSLTFFTTITFRGTGGYIISSVEYRGGGVLSYNGSGNPLSVGYFPDQPQLFEITVDMVGQTTSLSIDGVPIPEAQDYPFALATDAIVLTVSFGGTTPATIVMDDIHVEGVGCSVPTTTSTTPSSSTTSTSTTVVTTTSTIGSSSSSSSTMTSTTSTSTTSSTTTSTQPVACVPHYAPSYKGNLKFYRYATDLMYVKAKTGRICRACDGKRRGVLLKGKKPGFGFLQYGIDVGPSFEVHALLDVSKLRNAGVFTGVEFDSPAVPVGQVPPNFVFAGVALESDGSFTAFASHNGSDVGSTASIPAGTDSVEMRMSYDGLSLNVEYDTVPPSTTWPILQSYPFTYGGSGGLGAGLSNSDKGDQVGVGIEISGDLFEQERQALLCDLQAAIALETEALTDLDAGDTGDAMTEIENAIGVIDMGTAIPDTDPQQFTGGLVDRAKSLFSENAAAGKSVEKNLGSAEKKDGAAIKRIDKGKPDKAKKQVAAALGKKNRAKAVIETGNQKEKGNPL